VKKLDAYQRVKCGHKEILHLLPALSTDTASFKACSPYLHHVSNVKQPHPHSQKRCRTGSELPADPSQSNDLIWTPTVVNDEPETQMPDVIDVAMSAAAVCWNQTASVNINRDELDNQDDGSDSGDDDWESDSVPEQGDLSLEFWDELGESFECELMSIGV
jgi:hypothetical protein